MPELPEVETSCRGIRPHIQQQNVTQIIVRQPKLRWPIPEAIYEIQGQKIDNVTRRGKYILLVTAKGSAILHLGMSGSLRVLPKYIEPAKHDHVDILFTNECCLRYTDPRRFGALLWTSSDPYLHPLLEKLGPEPLAENFDGDMLYQLGQKSQKAIKTLIMDSHIVVGIGNIYATEALFLSGIHPKRKANQISKIRYAELIANIKQVLTAAIKQGGTTLRDFQTSEGKPGYFKQELLVYGREGENCVKCQTVLKKIIIGQRSTVYCPQCQR